MSSSGLLKAGSIDPLYTKVLSVQSLDLSGSAVPVIKHGTFVFNGASQEIPIAYTYASSNAFTTSLAPQSTCSYALTGQTVSTITAIGDNGVGVSWTTIG